MGNGTIQAAEGILKVFTGTYQKAYEQSKNLFALLDKGKGEVAPQRGHELPTGIEGNYRGTWMIEGGDFPAGGSVKTLRMKVYPKEYVHAMRLSLRSIREIKPDRTAVKDWHDLNVKEQRDAAFKLMNRYCMGTGDGVLATVSTGATSATQTFSNNNNTRFLKNGMSVEFWDPTFTTRRGSAAFTITSFPAPGDTTITVSSSVSTTTGDVVVLAGSANKAITGLDAIIDDTTEAPAMFQDQDRSVYRNLRAQVIDADGNAIDLTYLTQMIGAKIQTALGTVNRDRYRILVHQNQTAAFQSLGWQLARLEDPKRSKSIGLGYTSYSFQGIEITEETDMDKDRAYFLDASLIHKYVAQPWGWIQDDGKMLRFVPSETSGHAYKAYVEGYFGTSFNFGAKDVRGLGKIIDFAVTSGF